MSETTTNGQQDPAKTAPSGSSTSDMQQIAEQAASGLPAAQQGSVHAIVTATAQLADVNKEHPQDVAAGASNILTGYYLIALRQSQAVSGRRLARHQEARSRTMTFRPSVVGL